MREQFAPGVAVAVSYGNSRPAYLSAGTIAFDSQAAFDGDSICRLYSITRT